MKRVIRLFAVCACLLMGVTAVWAQSPPEGSLTVGLHKKTPHIEFGTTFLRDGNARAWAGVGSTVDAGGDLVGSFALLYQLHRTQAISIEVGAAYLAQNVGEKVDGQFDLVAKLSRAIGQSSSLSFAPTYDRGFLVQFQRRF